ncbi:GNAT family N-acetyltransferase [Salinicola avicenniae]|uniref:GNAT family N-acetyltransferase n=1 Tax=Salinicola avicenniae TaxID=2916836 RepID=UPI002072ED0F|nr:MULTISPECIES: GNAT family protein [unclassified Salinicola]
MSLATDRFGQPVGHDLDGWQIPPRPDGRLREGHYCRLEPLEAARHGSSLWQAWQQPDPHFPEDDGHARWTYLGGRPFNDKASCEAWLSRMAADIDLVCYAVVDRDSGDALGMATYLRIVPAEGALEIGHLSFAPRMARTPLSSEALSLMIEHAFALGYRRVEWKCDALNAPSRRAAERLGFRFEGVFRQHRVVSGRNRDTAWFAILDTEWPALQRAHRRWLAPDNFDAVGRQRQALSRLTSLLAASGTTET